MRKTIFTLFTALCITSVINVAKGQCVITAVPDPTAGYTPTQIVNGNFDEEPWMVFTYDNVTYTTCKDDKDFNSPSDDENGYAQDIVFNGVDGGWNTTDRYFWRSSLFEYTNTNSGTHDYRHNSSIQGTDKYVEMNNFHSCMLYQDLTTYSHDVIRWTLKHAVTTNGNEYQPIRVEIGAPNRDGQGHVINASGWAEDLNPQIDSSTLAIYHYDGVTDKDGHTSTLGFGSASDLQYLRLSKSSNGNGWWTAQGIYLIPAGQTVTRFGFISEAETNNMGNLLDDLTFTTIIGGLTASYGENGSIVVCGFWGEDDASKHLIIDINNIPHEVDMTAVTGQHFTLTVPEECIGGTVTSIAIYHEDYPGAESTISVNQHISVTAADVNAVYDGVTSWGINAMVTEPASGYTLTYGTSYNDCSLAVSPTFMLPGTHYVYYTVSAPGYTTEKRKATVFIDKLPFPLEVVITPPTPVEGLTYDKTNHTLISAGSASGGYTMVYALGTDNVTAPTGGWSTSLPEAKWVGDYYVWYKALGGDLHKDSEPAYVMASITAPSLLTLNLAVNNAAWGSIETQSAVYDNDFEDASDGAFESEGWINDATYPWRINGHQLMTSNAGYDGSSPSLQTTYDFEHDGMISFRYKISSESGWDKGYFKIDGNARIDGISGNGSWQTGTFAVTAGTHTFEWRYEKDVCCEYGDDAFYIDDIVITENRPDVTSSVQGVSGDKFLLKAVPASDDYSFVNWTSNNAVVSTEPTYMITLTRDTVLTANFQKDFEGSGTADDPYLIPSTGVWNRLATKVNSGTNYSGKYFRQTANISVTTMVGDGPVDNPEHPFSGTYDGDGYTLTVDYTNTDKSTAPFRFTSGACIKNLHTTGTITTNKKHAGGIIGFSYDADTLINCRSSVEINSNVDGDGTHGGLIGSVYGSATNPTKSIVIEGCLFDGRLLGSNTNSCGGFVGWCADDRNIRLYIQNSLFAPQQVSMSTSGCMTFSRASTLDYLSITNCYYTHSLGTVQGESAYSVTAGTGVTVAAAGTPTATYDVSGLAFYGTNGFTFNGVRYGGEGDAVSLNLSHGDAPANYSFSHYSADNGTLAGSDNPYTLTMTNANSVIDANYIIHYRLDSIPLTWQVKIGNTLIDLTPYDNEHPDSGYVMIPEGSEFYIIPSDEQKHLVSKLELIDKTPPTGVINGLFSVSATKQVYFSQGNLQYTKSTSTWSFMEHQWSTVETLEQYVGPDYANQDVVSIFGWGTSGISGYTPIATCYQPYSTNTNSEQYNPYGSMTTNLYDGGDNAGKADWSYAANAASLGGHSDWTTLTSSQWKYLLSDRTDASQKYGHGVVGSQNGLIILPDVFVIPDGLSFTAGNSEWTNSYTIAQWEKMEENGAVFLPAAGDRNGSTAYGAGSVGAYWSSTYYDSDPQDAYCVFFVSSDLGPQGRYHRFLGNSVRLVRDAE